jgi:hypothetical protein
VQEAVNVLAAHNKVAFDILAQFPGARVEPARRINDPVADRKARIVVDDDIPF